MMMNNFKQIKKSMKNNKIISLNKLICNLIYNREDLQ